MIDVPVPVKEALKDGFLKKNYRFVVEVDNWEISDHFETLYGFPDFLVEANKFVIIQDTNLYKFTIDSPNTNYTFYYYESGDWQILAPISTNTWIFAGTGDNTWCEICYTTGNRANITIEKHIDTLAIDNNNLVSESVNIDERMCSGDTIKFGLCEGSSLEFQYFGLENITGRRLQAFVDVQYPDYSDVTELNANSRITTGLYMSAEYVFTSWGHYRVIGTNSHLLDVWQIGQGTMHYVNFTTDSDGNKVVEFDVDLKNITKIRIRASQTGTTAKVQKFDNGGWHPIPLGFFTVENCSRQASTGIIKATCYNKLQSAYLDAKANETIAELVEQGEYGYTDMVSLYTLLKNLLQKYSIDQSSYGYIEPQLSDYQGSNLTAIRTCDDNGNWTSYYIYLYMIDIGFNLSADDFYKFEIFSSTLKNHAKDYVWPSYKYYKTKKGNTIYTLEQLANTDYTDGWDLCGSISLRKKVDINTNFFRIKGGSANSISNEYSECYQISISLPVYATRATSAPSIVPSVWRSYFDQNWGNDYEFVKILQKNLSNAEKIRITKAEVESFGDVTLRELQSAAYETVCQFGQLSRTTDLFSGVELNHSRLYPAESLYPANGLYPGGAALSANKSMYSQLWADEGNVHKWRYLIITYKGLDENNNEADFTLQRTVNADGTDDYNMSDNWLFRNLIWTAADVGDYADAMVAKMQDVTWFPFEMWCAGLPYLETGDEIEVPLGENSYTSYILQRQLKGIQNLQDTYINGTLDIF